MTPEERAASMEVLKKSIVMANKYGQQMLEEADNKTAVCTTAAAIMLSTFCSAGGLTLHDTVALLMSVHKQTELMMKERQQ